MVNMTRRSEEMLLENRVNLRIADRPCNQDMCMGVGSTNNSIKEQRTTNIGPKCFLNFHSIFMFKNASAILSIF